MSKANLPTPENNPGKAEWAEIFANDKALREAVNSINNEQIASGAGIVGSKLASAAGAEITGFKVGVIAPSENLTLSSSYQDLPGSETKVTASITSKLLVVASFSFESGGVNEYFGNLSVDGVEQTPPAFCVFGSNTKPAAPQVWAVSVSAKELTLKLRSKSVGGAGTSKCLAANTRALYVLLGS
jgi:hypothetical protein